MLLHQPIFIEIDNTICWLLPMRSIPSRILTLIDKRHDQGSNRNVGGRSKQHPESFREPRLIYLREQVPGGHSHGGASRQIDANSDAFLDVSAAVVDDVADGECDAWEDSELDEEDAGVSAAAILDWKEADDQVAHDGEACQNGEQTGTRPEPV